jgi:hypothetical protein
MSRLKRSIQTARFQPGARRVDVGSPFKQKGKFRVMNGAVASPHTLAR